MKLSSKGLILVSIPLAFELLFVGVLFFLLDKAEQESQLLAHSRSVIADEQICWGTFQNVPELTQAIERFISGIKAYAN